MYYEYVYVVELENWCGEGREALSFWVESVDLGAGLGAAWAEKKYQTFRTAHAIVSRLDYFYKRP